jgi:CheY-like chemotaxis protein
MTSEGIDFSASGDGIGLALLFNAVTEILLCSNNPILVKSLHGILRDEGYIVDIADHPAMAVQRVFEKVYSAAIMDPEPFGLSVEDAIRIIKRVRPEMLVIFVGYDQLEDVLNIEAPIDLEEFKRAIRNIHPSGMLSGTA